MINGKRYGWEDISVVMPYGVSADVQSIEYSDKRDVQFVYGKGSKPRGHGLGNYEAEGKMTMLKEEFLMVVAAGAASGGAGQIKSLIKGKKPSLKAGGVYEHEPFPIIVKYANTDQEVPQVDTLVDIKIESISESRKQGDTKAEVEIGFKILGGINRTGVPAI